MVVVLLSGLIPLHTALSQYDQKHETVQAKKMENFITTVSYVYYHKRQV